MRAHSIQVGLAVVVAASLAGLAACASDPVQGLDGSIAQGTWAGTATVPGRPADFTGILANHSGQALILKSATLLPVHGFRAPRLVHLAVELGRVYAAADNGWPPGAPGLRLVSFAGYRVRSGTRVQILYGVVAPKVGEYADSGIEVTLMLGGSTTTVTVVSYAGTCVKPSLKLDCPNSFYNRIQQASSTNP